MWCCIILLTGVALHQAVLLTGVVLHLLTGVVLHQAEAAQLKAETARLNAGADANETDDEQVEKCYSAPYCYSTLQCYPATQCYSPMLCSVPVLCSSLLLCQL